MEAFIAREFAKRPHLTRPGPSPIDPAEIRSMIDYYRGRLEARRQAREAKEMEDGDDGSESEDEIDTDTDTEDEEEVQDDDAEVEDDDALAKEQDGLMKEGLAVRGEEDGEGMGSDKEAWEDCEDGDEDEDEEAWEDCEDEEEGS